MFGSQGEQRVAVLSLVMSEAGALRERRGTSPLVLLDDVLSELDGERRAALAAMISRGAQTVVTATAAAALPGEPGAIAVGDAGARSLMERIGDEIQKELSRSGSRDAVPLAEVTSAWPAAVGDAVARNAWPLRISRDGTLHVAVESATWAQELSLLEGNVLEALRRQLGDDGAGRSCGSRSARSPSNRPPSSRSRSPPTVPPEVPPEVESEATSAAAAIDDPELRELVARAARTSLLKARSGR